MTIRDDTELPPRQPGMFVMAIEHPNHSIT
jgi:hypothetical protein